MTEVATPATKSRGKAKNNLGNFDIGRIEADLMAIESEGLKLDPSSQRIEKKETSTSAENDAKQATVVKDEASFKPRTVNVVNFNPEKSELLHRVLRSDQKPKFKIPKVVKEEPVKAESEAIKSKNSQPALKVKQPQPLKVFTQTKVKSNGDSKARPRAMEGLNRAPKAESVSNGARPFNLTSVALRGLKHANQFNQFALATHGTSLHHDIEKGSIFANAVSNSADLYGAELQTGGGQKVYNLKRRKAMLGGVDQHNLGSGKARKMLSSRSVKLLTPVLAVLFVGLYFVQLNLPNIKLKMAENRAGVSISQPSYTPDGFNLSGKIEAETGKVAMNFNKGQESYAVTQNVSDWDSKALLENKVLKETTEYSAYTDRGLTIYVYGGKAVWVNQGKVNEIDAASTKLDVEEMVRIAGSM